MSFYNATSGKFQPSTTATGDPGLTSQPYAGAEGYQSHGSYQDIKEFYTDIVYYDYGSPSYLGSSVISGGVSAHIGDKTYDVDYLLQLFAYFRSDGSANIAYALYSACAGAGSYPNGCGPAYNNCPWYSCPEASTTIVSGSWQNVGKAGDQIELAARWDPSNNIGWVFDYRDNASNPSWCQACWWTVDTYFPSGNYKTMLSAMNLGEISTVENPPVYTAYAFQVGFTMSSIPANSYWQLLSTATRYILSTGSSFTYLNHATSMEFCYLLHCSNPGYWDYWKELWTVSYYAAEHEGVTFSGAGGANYNDLWIYYSGTVQSEGGGVNFW